MPITLRGQCLVANKSLKDPNFHKTIVLLLEHTVGGATGLVLNRPSSILVAHALSGHFQIPNSDRVVFMGGPVEPSALLMLHDVHALGGPEVSTSPGVFIAESSDAFEQVLRTNDSNDDYGDRFRIFSGYSGWGEGQLEQEIDHGDWLLHPGGHQLVFGIDPYEAYDIALRQIFDATQLLPYRMTDPTLN
jgi:putative transcriptional regulator